MTSTFVFNVNESDFQTAVLERSKEVPVVVDFWAEWCGPCRTLGPLLEKVAGENAGAFELAKVDVDANPRLASAFGVQGIPTVIAFKDGKPVNQFTGSIPEASLRQFISQLTPPPVDPGVLEAEALADQGDLAGAENKLAEILAANPTNTEAALLAVGLMLERGATDEALELLGRQAPTAEVKRLEAAARLMSSGAVDLDSPEEALPRLLERVASGGDGREPARQVMLDIFELLGPDHPLTVQYRRQLANALF
ncbi:MAG: thioredoxin [Acidimicrobiia bacterium]|nr:thioredoxin [Acidimicrobiia bacterium]